MLIHILAIWNIYRPLDIFYGHFGIFVVICYILHRSGALCQEESGNPGYVQHPSAFKLSLKWLFQNI
jgi:hypothetical protein